MAASPHVARFAQALQEARHHRKQSQAAAASSVMPQMLTNQGKSRHSLQSQAGAVIPLLYQPDAFMRGSSMSLHIGDTHRRKWRV